MSAENRRIGQRRQTKIQSELNIVSKSSIGWPLPHCKCKHTRTHREENDSNRSWARQTECIRRRRRWNVKPKFRLVWLLCYKYSSGIAEWSKEENKKSKRESTDTQEMKRVREWKRRKGKRGRTPASAQVAIAKGKTLNIKLRAPYTIYIWNGLHMNTQTHPRTGTHIKRDILRMNVAVSSSLFDEGLRIAYADVFALGFKSYLYSFFIWSLLKFANIWINDKNWTLTQ